MRPCPVPLYLDQGRDVICHLDDLNFRPFIRERGTELNNVIDGINTRQTIVLRDCAFTVIREHEDVLDSAPSAYRVGPFFKNKKRYCPLAPPRGNMLAIKHELVNKRTPCNIMAEDVQKIMEGIIE